MSKYAFFGVGSAWNDLRSVVSRDKFPVALIDNCIDLQGRMIDGVPVISPVNAVEAEIDAFVVSGRYTDQMLAQLTELGVSRERILFYGVGSSDVLTGAMKLEHQKFCEYIGINFLPVGVCSVNILPMESYGYPGNDWCRYSTFRLVAEEVKRKNLSGAMAELGVYQGSTASYLNRLFPGKTLYLFDTFEGFSEADVNKESGEGFSVSRAGQFSDTNIALVLEKLSAPERVVVRKGYFPDTLDGLEEEFSLVSLDVDLYAPTISGLEYFYPRLQSGGYLFIHDYNNVRFEGVCSAVRDFMNSYGNIPFVPLPDACGSVVVCKP
jgi:O-methyltransferase